MTEHDDDTEAEGISVADVDHWMRVTAAWETVAKALRENAADRLSAGDVCAIAHEMNRRLKDPERHTYADMLRGPIL